MKDKQASGNIGELSWLKAIIQNVRNEKTNIHKVLDKLTSNSFHAFFAPEDLESVMKKEVQTKIYSSGRLILAAPQKHSAYFVQNKFTNPRLIQFKSMQDLQQLLTSYDLPIYFQTDRKPSVPEILNRPLKALEFLKKVSDRRWLEWALLDSNLALVSEQVGKFPLNKIDFLEDKRAPSRAYLKLWEIFTRFQKYPAKGSLCLDLGSAPGGWTYVLNNLQANIMSYDRVELDKNLVSSGNVQHFLRDAFGVSPSEFQNVDWLFSDLICYPQKLFDFVRSWHDSGKVKNFVCTLKFQGATDWMAIKAFESLGGDLIHLSHNKHELTWVKLES